MSAKPEPKAAEKAAAAEPKQPETAAKTAPKAAETAAKVKVKFLRSHPAFAHFVGDKAEIAAADYEKYRQDGPFFEKL